MRGHNRRAVDRWASPIDQLLGLRAAMRHLTSRKNARERLDAATFALARFRPDDYPWRLRQRVDNILKARLAVRQDYGPETLFRFDLLSPPQRKDLESDITAVYEACLLDIGHNDQDSYDIVYPNAGEARVPRVLPDPNLQPEKMPPLRRKRRRRGGFAPL